MVRLPRAVCRQYTALSRFNSPYPAHDRGHAIDLYPATGAPSPVAGEVVDHRRVRAPRRSYAEPHDHLLVIDTGDHLARLLHVEPSVTIGDRIVVGTDLGRLVRSGYFAPWVDNHLHLGFRTHNTDVVRASGSLPLEVEVDIVPVRWDGTGTVVERGETYAIIDAPAHPSPGERFAGVAARLDGPTGSTAVPLDGGLPHYSGAGLQDGDTGPVRFLGPVVGDTTDGVVTWNDVEIRVNGQVVTGLSLTIQRDRLGAKLVSWGGVPVDIGGRVAVTVEPR